MSLLASETPGFSQARADGTTSARLAIGYTSAVCTNQQIARTARNGQAAQATRPQA
jgi:hypothetical protein